MAYTRKVNFTVTNAYVTPRDEDDVYTVEEFKQCVAEGLFTDYDGFGEPVKDNRADKGIWIYPSKLELIPADATHIVWYNR